MKLKFWAVLPEIPAIAKGSILQFPGKEAKLQAQAGMPKVDLAKAEKFPVEVESEYVPPAGTLIVLDTVITEVLRTALNVLGGCIDVFVLCPPEVAKNFGKPPKGEPAKEPTNDAPPTV